MAAVLSLAMNFYSMSIYGLKICRLDPKSNDSPTWFGSKLYSTSKRASKKRLYLSFKKVLKKQTLVVRLC